MSPDRWILVAVWLVSFLILFTIPRRRIRLGLIAFLFKQLITCPLGLIAVELGLLEYPVRFFADINRTSFTYEYVAYPAVCAVFNVHFPNRRGRLFQLGYFIAFCTGLTVIELLLEHYANVVRYIQWNWMFTWSSLFITFLLVRLFCSWFFQEVRNQSAV